MMIKWTVLALTLVGGLYRVVLNLLRRRSANNPTPQNVADVYDAETYQTWKRYSAEHCRLDIVSTVLSFVLTVIFGKYVDTTFVIPLPTSLK